MIRIFSFLIICIVSNNVEYVMLNSFQHLAPIGNQGFKEQTLKQVQGDVL